MNKRGMTGLIMGLIILLVVMTIIIISTSDQFSNLNAKLSILSLNKNKINTEVIKNKCELACLEGDEETYCKTYQLYTNTTQAYKGTCAELSERDYDNFSINKCGEITCS